MPQPLLEPSVPLLLPLPLPLSPSLSFSHCKYQLLFFSFFLLLYCSCNFILFSLAEGSWCSSDQAPSPQSVCKYNFISVPGSGGITEQNVSLVFILSPSISLSLPFSHKYYDHFIYCILGGLFCFSGEGLLSAEGFIL